MGSSQARRRYITGNHIINTFRCYTHRTLGGINSSLAAAAAILNRRDIQVQAANLVQDAERAIAKANPPKQRGGDRRSDDFQSTSQRDIEKPLPDKTIQNIRQAHDKLTDAEYEKAKTEAVVNQEPLTRKDL